MSYLYEMRLSQEMLEMPSLSVNTQLNTTLHVSEGGCQKHLASLLTTEWNMSSKQVPQPSLSVFIIFILSFRVANFLFCEFSKHTTAFHYRYDMQMYCTFVLFVNQHFPGLPVSETHCITNYCQLSVVLLLSNRWQWSICAITDSTWVTANIVVFLTALTFSP
jgi:hypothetical protein